MCASDLVGPRRGRGYRTGAGRERRHSRASEEGDQRRRISGNSGDAALRMVDSRFALEPASFPLPVKPRLKRPPRRGCCSTSRRRDPLAAQPDGRAADRQPDQDDDRAPGRGERAEGPCDGQPEGGAHSGLRDRSAPVGSRPARPLLKALIMISANDAAVALAEHESNARRLRRADERRARSMSLRLHPVLYPKRAQGRGQSLLRARSGGARPSGPRRPRIAAIARTRYAKPPFPIKDGGCTSRTTTTSSPMD